MNEAKDWTYIRSYDGAIKLLANDESTLEDTPKQIAKKVLALTDALFEAQQTFIEGNELFTNTDPFPSQSSRPQRSSSNGSTRRSSGSGGLKLSDKQEKFFKSVIHEIEGLGEEPNYSFEDLQQSTSYDQRQDRVNELLEQRDALKL